MRRPDGQPQASLPGSLEGTRCASRPALIGVPAAWDSLRVERKVTGVHFPNVSADSACARLETSGLGPHFLARGFLYLVLTRGVSLLGAQAAVRTSLQPERPDDLTDSLRRNVELVGDFHLGHLGGQHEFADLLLKRSCGQGALRL